MSADGMTLAAGTVTFLGHMHKEGQFPEQGVSIITATIALTLIAAATRGTPIEPPFKAFAALGLLVAIYVHVPAFRKDKRNG
jgi:hypothetical protein